VATWYACKLRDMPPEEADASNLTHHLNDAPLSGETLIASISFLDLA
jgi:hypothetical protein